uniref:Uncharacterized protein LOC104240352 n=1 Tax=Nicotiana sylvestris TaxID=4096 RepID=A0A1U7XV24_NICSY|nr:PREDICTED: uncharacterized protein LOC104240352 [Nicotiana sylvestris]
MKFNPEKCAFRVGSDKFLGFMFSNRGIVINHDKIRAIEEITVVNNVKAIQRLTGRIAALGIFISRSSDKDTTSSPNLKKEQLRMDSGMPTCPGRTETSIKTAKLINIETEYRAMIAGLELAKGLGAEVIEAKCDSVLVVSQNSEADTLANLASSVEEEDLLPEAVFQLIRSLVKEGHAKINSTSLRWDWRNKYIVYLKDRKLPTDPKESRALRTRAARFSLDENGALYRREFDGPLAVCLGLDDTDYVLREIHEGTCGNHSGQAP